MRCGTKSVAETSYGVGGPKVRATRAHRVSTGSPWSRSTSTSVVRLLDELADELREGRYRPLPARRVFIPKPGVADERRPLSIPFSS